ncbi:hypothetical protein F5Y17DRAFT_245520 [Xylariaceae sp. FL0594]|nr:hypothetical protein F5Y17DRAFT_245520 [Xylariaceae sp. FL0594]
MRQHFSRCKEISESLPHLRLLPKALEILRNWSSALCDMSRYTHSMQLANKLMEFLDDGNPGSRAYLLNIKGLRDFELNYPNSCRRNWEQALKVCESWAREGDNPEAREELANQLKCSGDLLAAEDEYDKALDLLRRAEEIRTTLDQAATRSLGGAICTSMGRAYFLKGDEASAQKHFDKAMGIYG